MEEESLHGHREGRGTDPVIGPEAGGSPVTQDHRGVLPKGACAPPLPLVHVQHRQTEM